MGYAKFARISASALSVENRKEVEMKIRITKSEKRGLPTLAEIYRLEFSKPPYNEKWTVKKARDKMDFFSKYYDSYTIKIDDEIAGFIVINPKFMCPGEVAFGEEMAIKEEYKRKGVGTYTLNKIFNIYKKKGFKVYMGIVNKNSNSFELHKKVNAKESKSDIVVIKKLK